MPHAFRTRTLLWTALLAAAWLAGCTGEVTQEPSSLTAEDGGMAFSDGGGLPSPISKQTGYKVAPDQGTPDAQPPTKAADKGPGKKDQGKPTTSKGDGSTPPWGDLWSSGWPDFSSPDLTLTKTPGGKCPCAAGLLCMANTCRAFCKKPTDACGVISNCAAGHACVSVTYNGKKTHACLPGVGAGKSCAKAFCADNRVCGSVNKKPLVCLPTCTKAFAACGAGGVCLKATGSNCLFCTKP